MTMPTRAYKHLICVTGFNFTARELFLFSLTVIMSGRKRKNYDPNDPRNWPKERYIERLKTMGIGINSSGSLETIISRKPSKRYTYPI